MRKKRFMIGRYIEVAIIDIVYYIVDILIKGLIFYLLWNYMMTKVMHVAHITLLQGLVSGLFWSIVGSDAFMILKMKHFRGK